MGNQLTFHANGKILLTGEYLVLKGAEALALPLHVGQKMSVDDRAEEGVLTWSASDPEGIWFSGEFSTSGFRVISTADHEMAGRLIKVLHAARTLNGDFLQSEHGFNVVTRLEFNRKWGFGSSSTLTSLLAQWAGVDPMQLHRMISDGSGYDVACSLQDTPLIFSLKNGVPQVEPADFNPPFLEEIRIIYLDSKQNSDTEVETFRKKNDSSFHEEVDHISRLTRSVAEAESREQFMSLLAAHEKLIAGVLGRTTVKDRLFPDFNGVVKSLGAWGGDFVLALSLAGSDYTEAYFRKKSFSVILPLSTLVRLSGKNESKTQQSLQV